MASEQGVDCGLDFQVGDLANGLVPTGQLVIKLPCLEFFKGLVDCLKYLFLQLSLQIGISNDAFLPRD